VLVLCAGLWSLNGPLIKILSADGVSALSIAFYRSLIGGVALLPLALRHFRTVGNVSIGWPIAAIALFTLMTVTFVKATTGTAAANAVVLQYTSPIWVFGFSILLLGERPRLAESLALLIAMAGVGVIFFGHPTAELPVLAIALASGFGFGGLTVALRGLRRVHPFVVACLNGVGSGLILGIAVGVSGSFGLTPRQAGLLVLLSLVQFMLPYVLFSWALARVEAHRAAIVVLLETVLNPLWTWLAVGEPVPAPTRVGGPLIVAGVLTWTMLALLRARRIERAVRAGNVPPEEASDARPAAAPDAAHS
jgi:drug/metabolite transporter (DMT)-like permease